MKLILLPILLAVCGVATPLTAQEPPPISPPLPPKEVEKEEDRPLGSPLPLPDESGIENVPPPNRPDAPTPIKEPTGTLTPQSKRDYTFQGEPTSDVLRQLARDAGINLIIERGVSGTVTFKLQEVTPLQAIAVLVTSRKYTMDREDNVYTIRNPNQSDEPEGIIESKATIDSVETEIEQWIAMVARQVKKAARDPDLPDAFAEFYWNYYQALIAKGFTEQQAMLILGNLSVPVEVLETE